LNYGWLWRHPFLLTGAWQGRVFYLVVQLLSYLNKSWTLQALKEHTSRIDNCEMILDAVQVVCGAREAPVFDVQLMLITTVFRA
jgi:hypothetical protein